MIALPERCPRGLACCRPLAQIVSTDGGSFICVGENDGSDRAEPGDDLTKCVRSVGGVDERVHADERDLIDEAAIVMGALSVRVNARLAALQRGFGGRLVAQASEPPEREGDDFSHCPQRYLHATLPMGAACDCGFGHVGP